MNTDKWNKAFEADRKRDMDPLVLVEGPQGRYEFGGADRGFHVASVGKMFTAVLAGRLMEAGKLDWDSRIADWFTREELAGLFIFQGRDYQDEVTISQLLSHRSGIADATGDKGKNGRNYLKIMLQQPDTFVEPWDLINFTREHQQAVGKPGTYHYSDTGYNLIGLLLERVDGRPFHQQLHEEIFTPLGMTRSYLALRSEPEDKEALNNPQPTLVKGVDVSKHQSLSMDWAGGGVMSTLRDMLRFQQALVSGQLISPGLLTRMQEPVARFRKGIHNGFGFMEIRFGEFFFLLKNLPRLKGHIGILSTHLQYDQTSGTHYVISYGDTRRMGHSFQRLVLLMR